MRTASSLRRLYGFTSNADKEKERNAQIKQLVATAIINEKPATPMSILKNARNYNGGWTKDDSISPSGIELKKRLIKGTETAIAGTPHDYQSPMI